MSYQLISDVLQSEIKEFHSTETALLTLYNDITLNIDQGKVTSLTLLDLPAAFYTTDHNTLSNVYLFCTAYCLILLSYLPGRLKTVKIIAF